MMPSPDTSPKKTPWALRAAAVLCWLLIWQGAALLLRQPLLLSSPWRVMQRLFSLLGERAFYRALGFSLSRILLGFAAGALLGAGLALAAARLRALDVFLQPLMHAVRAAPVASFIILAFVFLSSRYLSVFISFLMVLPIVYGHLLEGLRAADPRLLEMARVYRVPGRRRLLYIHLPLLRPYLTSALSLSLGMSWKAGVAAEVIGIPAGSMGEALYQAKVYVDMSALYAWTLVIVLLSVCLEKLFAALLRAGFGRLERL